MDRDSRDPLGMRRITVCHCDSHLTAAQQHAAVPAYSPHRAGQTELPGNAASDPDCVEAKVTNTQTGFIIHNCTQTLAM